MFAPAPSVAADLLLLPSALLDALSDPVLVIGPDARLERLNRAALRRLALEPGTALADLRPVLGDPLHARLHAALVGEPSHAAAPGDASTLVALGQGRWALVLPAVVGSGVRELATDPVDEVMALRDQLERLAHEHLHWFESVPVGLVMFDATGLVLQSNARLAQLVGEVPVDLGEAGRPACRDDGCVRGSAAAACARACVAISG